MSHSNQAQLNEVTREKFYKKLDALQSNANPFLQRIESESRLVNDFISPLGANTGITFTSNGNVKMKYSDNKEYTLHKHAIQQIGDKFGINSTFVKDLVNSEEKWKRDLIATNLNEFSTHSKRQRVLVREIDGEVRGVLSDSYRRLNTSTIFETFIASSKNSGALIIDAFSDGIKSYIETLSPELIEIPFGNNAGTLVAFGMRIQNSDFGASALDVRAFMMQAICINGAVTESLIRQVHLGRTLPDDLRLSDRTYRLDTETQASLISDMVKNNFGKDSILKKAKIIQDAEFTEVDLDKEIKVLNKANQISKVEGESIMKIFANNRVEDGVGGSNSLWKLTQGIGALARDSKPDRKRELNEVSGELLKRVQR